MASFTRDWASTLGVSLVGALSGFASSLLTAHYLGPEGRGLLTVALLLPSILVAVANLGLPTATIYYAARAELPPPAIIGNNILLGLLAAAASALVGALVLLLSADSMFKGPQPTHFLLAFAALVPQTLYTFMRPILLGYREVKGYNAAGVAQSLLIVTVLAISFLAFSPSVAVSLSAILLAWWLAAVFVLVLLLRRSGTVDLRLRCSYVRKALGYGLKAHVANILAMLLYRVDLLLLNSLKGPDAVGLYSLAVAAAESLNMISQAGATLLLPRVAAAASQQPTDPFVGLLMRTTVLATALAALVLSCCAPLVFVLCFPPAFMPALSGFYAILPGIVAMSGTRVLCNFLAGYGRPHLNIVVGAAALALNVVLNLLWIPKWGMVGAGFASSVSYFLALAVAGRFYARITQVSWKETFIPRAADWVLYRSRLELLLRFR
ncbi:polysaccharide biosynthesis C-terminal domain-containing protein [Limisphaera sp. VF-2]|uniref:oligosaccharide flippase family protein n=1 Tax=Limisphaera sp. VF-2 TaxID=3400418 RepID=UPI003C20CA62